jgi:hypothetical protein
MKREKAERCKARVRENVQSQMGRVISIHEYRLKPDIEAAAFELAIHKAEELGLLQFPGLVGYHFVRGLRGVRQGLYAAIWIYSSLDAWEALWGPVDEPIRPEQYPEKWKIWEDQVLTQYLDGKPDRLVYTAYEEI